jgi:hypothetical protein
MEGLKKTTKTSVKMVRRIKRIHDALEEKGVDETTEDGYRGITSGNQKSLTLIYQYIHIPLYVSYICISTNTQGDKKSLHTHMHVTCVSCDWMTFTQL